MPPPNQNQTAAGLTNAINALTTTSNVAARAVSNLAIMTNGSVGGMATGFGNAMGAMLGMVGQVAGKIKHPVAQAIAVVADGVGKMVTIIGSVLGQALEQAIKLASMFRPDLAIRFEQVMKDTLATIGENLVPVLQITIKAVKWLGDQFAGFTSTVKPQIEAAARAMVQIGKSIDVLWREALAPALKDIMEVMGEMLVMSLQMSAAMLKMSEGGFKAIGMLLKLGNLLGMLGLVSNDFKEGNSAGKAAGMAHHTTTDELYRGLAQATYGSGREDPAKQSAGYLFDIKDLLSRFVPDLVEVLKVYKQAKEKIKEAKDVAADPMQFMYKKMIGMMELKRF